ncbi:MAG: MFS transporter [Chloroflexota bacterium]
MTPRVRLVLLAALCAGALLVGIELMITAVALPKIVVDLADWTQLRRASWIVNGYLLAYIAMMPLAGRLGDRYGIPRLYMLALALFAIGSVLSGSAGSLDALIAARIVQGLGAGAILPLATAGASHLYDGHARARALGVVGAATFLGMAMGPFLGATVLETFQLGPALDHSHVLTGFKEVLAPSWRWIFYLGAPLSLMALAWVWALAPRWQVERVPGRLDAFGAVLWTVALAATLIALTALGESDAPGAIPVPVVAGLIAVVTIGAAIRHALRTPEPFIDPRLFKDRVFSGAMLLSLMTGYALATAIVGAAVYVDRVRYQGPAEQRVVLGSLALAMAIGALASGFLLRRFGIVLLTVVGIALSTAGLVTLGLSNPATPLPVLLAGLAAYGLGFGLTVTPRSTAAVEALGRRAYGIASAGVTVARMAGMAVGLAVLTGFGTSRIEALSVVLTDAAARDAVLPIALRGRPLVDPQVIGALETWAAAEAGSILGGLFLVAAAITLAGLLPTLLMRGSTARDGRATMPGDMPPDGDLDDHGPAFDA